MSALQGVRPRLTRRVHERLAEVLEPGDLAVDATVGNGHDTLELARLVAPGGRVIGCDVQPEALAAARRRVDAAGLGDLVELHRGGHEHLADYVPEPAHGRVAAVTFNLGYLPGGDKTVTTEPQTTRLAIEAAAGLLRPGGLLSLLVYVGHRGGKAELTMVEDWLAANGEAFGIEIHRGTTDNSPVLFLLTCKAA